jgi:hypothetical protein
MSLGLRGYCLDVDDNAITKPIVKIDFPEDVQKFIVDNVQSEKELQILNSANQITLHIKNQTLLYPIPEGGSDRNKWNPQEKKFVTIDILNK